MTQGEAFTRALELTLSYEGGYSDHPADAGGRTYRGVTQGAWNDFCERTNRPPSDVTTITEADRTAFYRAYWDAVGGDTLPPGVATVAFDCGVLHGPGRARRWLLETQTPFGLTERRVALMFRHEDYDVFGKGWLRRAWGVYAASKAYPERVTRVLFHHPGGVVDMAGEALLRQREGKLDVRFTDQIAVQELRGVTDALA